MQRGGGTMTTQAVARRCRPRGAHPKTSDSSAQPRKLPEYHEAHEVEAIIRATDNPRAKLLMLEQWEGRVAHRGGTGTRGRRPLPRCRASDAEGSGRQGQQDENRTDAPRAAGRAEVDAILWEHQPGEARRYSPRRRHGAGSGRRSGGLRSWGRSCPDAR